MLRSIAFFLASILAVFGLVFVGADARQLRGQASLTAPVGACSSLGTPGTWVNITPPGVTLSAPYQGVLVVMHDPNNSGTVYATTYQSGIYKSTNCGATWVKVNTGTNGSQLDTGRIWSAQLDPTNTQVMYANSGYGAGGVWKSTDGGVDWVNKGPSNSGVPTDMFIERIQMDPTNHLHLLVIFHENCTTPYNPLCIAETTDGGNTWNITNFPTSLANSWGEGFYLDPLGGTNWLMQASVLYYSSNSGGTWTQASSSSVANIQGQPFTDPSGNLWLSSTNGNLYSSNGGATWQTVTNSAGGGDAAWGCGNSLYSGIGFQPPSNSNYLYTATYANSMSSTGWSVYPNTGLTPLPPISGIDYLDCDPTQGSHGILYVAAQATGLYRIAVTN